jgi:hypothetical protein
MSLEERLEANPVDGVVLATPATGGPARLKATAPDSTVPAPATRTGGGGQSAGYLQAAAHAGRPEEEPRQATCRGSFISDRRSLLQAAKRIRIGIHLRAGVESR